MELAGVALGPSLGLLLPAEYDQINDKFESLAVSATGPFQLYLTQ